MIDVSRRTHDYVSHGRSGLCSLWDQKTARDVFASSAGAASEKAASRLRFPLS
jgi:hypothetical protein